MSVFTAGDVADMAAGGNLAHNTIYMANSNAGTNIPNGSDVGKLREFIKSKYNDKKWCSGSGDHDRRRESVSGYETSGDSNLWGTKQSSTSNANRGGTVAAIKVRNRNISQ